MINWGRAKRGLMLPWDYYILLHQNHWVCQRVSHYALFCKSQAIAAIIEFKILTSISGNSSQKLHCGNVVNVLWCQEFLSWWVLSGTISGMSRLLALISDINESHRLTWDLNGCQDSGALNSANNSPYLYQLNKIYGSINNQVEPSVSWVLCAITVQTTGEGAKTLINIIIGPWEGFGELNA